MKPSPSQHSLAPLGSTVFQLDVAAADQRVAHKRALLRASTPTGVRPRGNCYGPNWQRRVDARLRDAGRPAYIAVLINVAAALTVILDGNDLRPSPFSPGIERAFRVLETRVRHRITEDLRTWRAAQMPRSRALVVVPSRAIVPVGLPVILSAPSKPHSPSLLVGVGGRGWGELPLLLPAPYLPELRRLAASLRRLSGEARPSSPDTWAIYNWTTGRAVLTRNPASITITSPKGITSRYQLGL